MNALIEVASNEEPQAVYRPLGTAQWLSPASVIRPFRPGDFRLGQTADDRILGVRDDRHIGVVGGTRGGKGTDVVVPNLLHWLGSTVVIDPKGENAMVTARRRGNGSLYAPGLGQTVRILDPFDIVRNQVDEFRDLKCCFNPMDAIRPSREESIDIAARLSDANVISESASDPFWPDSGKDLIQDVMLHVSSSPEFTDADRNLVTVRRLIVTGEAKAGSHSVLFPELDTKDVSRYQKLAKAMMRNKAYNGRVAEGGARLAELAKSPKTLLGIVQVAATNLSYLNSPGMARAVSKSDFSLSELKTSKIGSTIYLCLPQRYMGTHFRWLRMMVTLIIGEMEEIKHQPACGHRVLMVLDEFPALRRMTVLENAAAQIAGFGVKLLMVSQTLAQIKEIYKDNWETLLANCGIKLFFGNDDHFTRDYVSRLVGETEVVRTASSKSSTSASSTSTTQSFTTGQTTGMNEGMSHGFSHGASAAGSTSYNASMGLSHGFTQSTAVSTATGSTRSYTFGSSDSVQKRFLLNPDEVGRFFGDRKNPMMLTLLSGHQPLALRRVPYFRDLQLAGFYDPHLDHPLPPTVGEGVFMRRQHDNEIRRAAQAEKDRLRREREQREQAALLRHREASLRAEKFRRAQERRREELERQARENTIGGYDIAMLAFSLLVFSVLSVKWLYS